MAFSNHFIHEICSVSRIEFHTDSDYFYNLYNHLLHILEVFERKFRDKKIIDRRFIFKFAALGSVFLVSIGLLGHFNNGFDERLS
ncbi:MAG: hypothetical protein CM15mP12_3680 [Gammaproteobacteria bacterium]|nr:MAG: hypothetical protein CM15mP12_3680 [Gammaproteobacteria bacterium]